MIVVRLKGGLGNQLFQYAFGYILAKKNADCLKLDIEWFDTEGNVPWLTKRSYELNKFLIGSSEIIKHKELPFIPRFFGNRYVRRLFALFKKDNIKFGNWLIVSTTSSFNYMNLPKSENILLNGYFDNYAAVYLKGYMEDLRTEFECEKYSSSTMELINYIKSKENATSIHIRRTDQLHDKGHKAGVDYYIKAIEYFVHMDCNITFFVFSDDIEWCKSFLDCYDNVIYVSDKKNPDTLRDFLGMMNCKNNIIAYSTYSWWAAMLNKHKDKIIISPEFYDTVDFLPDNWIVLRG